MDLYDADDEDEVTPSWKRQKTGPADDDTRVVEYPDAQEIPGGPLYQSSSESESESTTAPADDNTRVVVVVENPPEAQELPWGPVEILSDTDTESECEVITSTRPDYHHAVDEEKEEDEEEDAWIINTPPHYYDDVDEDAIASSPAHEKDDDDKDEFEVITRTRPDDNQEVDEEKEDKDEDEEEEMVYDAFYIRTPSPYYGEVDEDAIASSPAHEKNDDDDKDFTFSPASPPPPPPPPPPTTTSTTTTSTSTPTTLYVLPNSTIVLTPDGGCEHIPDQRTITPPKPSTSTANDEDTRQVCSPHMQIQNNIAALIAHQWRASAPSTVEETTVDVCREVAFTILSASYQNILMNYVRCAIRRPR